MELIQRLANEEIQLRRIILEQITYLRKNLPILREDEKSNTMQRIRDTRVVLINIRDDRLALEARIAPVNMDAAIMDAAIMDAHAAMAQANAAIDRVLTPSLLSRLGNAIWEFTDRATFSEDSDEHLGKKTKRKSKKRTPIRNPKCSKHS